MERIIKYKNRKLYSKETAKYITLPQILERIRNSKNIQVIDNETSRDLTRLTIAKAEWQAKQERLKRGEN